MKKTEYKAFYLYLGLVLILVLSVFAVFAPLLSPFDLHYYNLSDSFLSPNTTHWFGCDFEGRDIFTLVLYGARVSLGIALVVTLVSFVLGSLLGLCGALCRGPIDNAILFLTDVFLAFPSFLFAIAVAAFLRPSISNVIFILSLKGWVSYARLIRGQALSLREQAYVQSSIALGASKSRIAFKDLLPNMLGPLVINASFGMAGVIMIESSLSFLGLGVPAGTPSWGALLDQGTQYLLIAPHLSFFPGLCIMLVVLAFNFLGDGLRDRFVPDTK